MLFNSIMFPGTNLPNFTLEQIERSPKVNAVFSGTWKGRLLRIDSANGFYILAREKTDGEYQCMLFPIASTKIFYETLDE